MQDFDGGVTEVYLFARHSLRGKFKAWSLVGMENSSEELRKKSHLGIY